MNERERDPGGTDGAHAALQPPPSHPFFAGLVRRPVLLSTLFLTCIVVGLISWTRIPIQMMPAGIVNPGLMIFAQNSGASATENEERVARIVEEELRTLPAVEEIESQSGTDSVEIFVQFEASTDMNFAKAEVRDRIERARPKLPATVQEIGIFSWSRSDLPIMFFALKHPGDSERTDFLVEKVIQRRIEAVDGVGKVEVWGSLDDSLRILLDETKVRAARLDLGALVRRLATDNFSLSLGEVDDGGSRILLRSDMRFRTTEEILDYPVGDGLRIRDIATVVPVKSVRESLFRIDGQYAYFIEIRKDGQANIVETCQRLHAELARIEKAPELRGEFTFVPIFDQGRYIEGALNQLTDSAWEGGILAIVVLFFFLWRVRQTLLVALAIPISVLLAIAWCFFTGRSFNILTMTGITLALGMLVDNAIVVIENITRLRQAGHAPRAAVVEGTGEVALAVAEQVAGLDVLELRDGADLAGAERRDRGVVLALEHEQLPDALLAVAARVDQDGVGPDGAGEDAEERELARERVGDGLQHPRRKRRSRVGRTLRIGACLRILAHHRGVLGGGGHDAVHAPLDHLHA